MRILRDSLFKFFERMEEERLIGEEMEDYVRVASVSNVLEPSQGIFRLLDPSFFDFMRDYSQKNTRIERKW